MNKIISSILFGAFSFFMADTSFAETVPPQIEILKEMRAAVRIISTFAGPGGSFMTACSGVWIGSRHILTANHCLITNHESDRDVLDSDGRFRTVKNPGKIVSIKFDTVFTNAEDEFAGDIVRVAGSENCDVMVVRTDDPVADHPIIELRKTDLQIGERVATIGHPGMSTFVHTFGEVSGIDVLLPKVSMNRSFNLININVGHGSSGGPLFDMQGRLAGIASSILNAGEARFGVFANRKCMTTVVSEAKKIEKEREIDW